MKILFIYLMEYTQEEALAQLNVFLFASKGKVTLPLGDYDANKEKISTVLEASIKRCSEKWGEPQFRGAVKEATFPHDLHRHIQWLMGGAEEFIWWETAKYYGVLLLKTHDARSITDILIEVFPKK